MKLNKDTPIDFEIVKKNIERADSRNIRAGNIRIIRQLTNDIEDETGTKFIRMEMGVPGIKPSQIGIDAEIKALQSDVAGVYPPIEGVELLKIEMSKFVKLFLNIDVPPLCCLPTVGSINASYASFMVANRRIKEKDTILFINPGFPAHEKIVKMLGFKQVAFDVYDYRGAKLREKLTEMFESGNISAMLYSNPNNPTWICFTDEELEIIGELATKYDVIVLEDLAYFGMDFRKDYALPGQSPFQPTIAKYTDNYILLMSGSKSFSYAGQRIGVLVVSETLFKTKYIDLMEYFPMDTFGGAMISGSILLTTAGVAHSVQYGLAEILKAANEGKYNFIEDVKVYGKNAKIMKKIFIDNGFKIVYDKDGDELLADGFYFTVAFPDIDGDELSEMLLYYGISSLPLSSTGSIKTEGIRACVSMFNEEQIPELESRLKKFSKHYGV